MTERRNIRVQRAEIETPENTEDETEEPAEETLEMRVETGKSRGLRVEQPPTGALLKGSGQQNGHSSL
ncbi:hypothetical protein NHX12_016889 [Muraenolepis orangiensis]|uniref:Uncharacterized protein n=1 Tax=Muraenolepis orangiensis TaxID=630683 RepID=A0A9Q0D663_9TELE|nr:hypothetical protein NHX12_016889 [Muraenolepis orangiensis]